MKYDPLFDRDENKTLLAICTRKLIANIGIGGVIWGAVNVALGIVLARENPVNLAVVLLGVMMLGVGVQALKSPSLRVLLTETFVAGFLFLWNAVVFVVNLPTGDISPAIVIFPLVVVVTLAGYYTRLRHLRDQIASVEPEQIKAAKKTCKELLAKKLKDEPLVVQCGGNKCRGQLMDDRAFFIQRDLLRAFVATREEIRNAVAKPEAPRWKIVLNHPVKKLTYDFDKKNTAKLKAWVEGETGGASGELVSAT